MRSTDLRGTEGAPAASRPGLRPALLESLRGYTVGDFGRDAVAGLVVACVAIPLAIAFAIGSHANPTNGLVTVVIAGGVAALAGGSRFLVTGPTGAFVVVLAGVVDTFERAHPGEGLAYLFLATLVAGVLLLVGGLLRLGTVLKFVPYPVTVGFTAGIAVTIFANQLPDLLGVSLGPGAPAEPLVKAWLVLEAAVAGQWLPWAGGIAFGTILVIQGMRKFAPRVPGPIVAVVVFTALAWWMAGTASTDSIVTVASKYELPAGLPPPSLPDLRAEDGSSAWASLPTLWSKIREVFPSAVTIAVLGAIESLLAAVVADGMAGARPQGKSVRHDSNQELVGQGLANIASPLFGGIAATGAIARTATNVQSGARTPVASLVHVAVVAAVLYVAAPLAGRIPLACLAGILAVVAWNMSERHHIARILRMPRSDAAVLVATFAVTVLVDLTWGVVVGLLAAFALFLHRMSGMTRVGAFDADARPSEPRFRPEDVPPGVVVYSIDGPFFFGAADQFSEAMSRVAEPPRAVVLRLRDVPYLDATGLNALERAIEQFRRRGSQVVLSAAQPQPLDLMRRAGTLRVVGEENVVADTPAALAMLRA